MKIEYTGGGLLYIRAETKADVVRMTEAASRASANGYPLTVEITDADSVDCGSDSEDEVWLTISLRQRAPAERRGRKADQAAETPSDAAGDAPESGNGMFAGSEERKT